MINNKVKFAQGAAGKAINRVTAEEAELVSKALYTGHAVFWNDSITMLNYNYTDLNIAPGLPIESGDSQLT